MIVAGVDLGVKKAAVAILGVGASGAETFTTSAFHSKATSRSAQLREVREWVHWQTYKLDAVYVEKALVGKNTDVSLQIAQTAGAVMSVLEQPSYFVSNTVWKKDVCGKGNLSKDLVAKWLDEHFPDYSHWCDGDQDRIDAACIAIYGQRQQQLAARFSQDTDDLLRATAIPDGEALA